MNMAIDINESQLSLSDYKRIFLRRKKLFYIPLVAMLTLAVLAATLWPAKYRSSATILIEEQEIPQDLVRSTITSYANQQIQVITQRTMTLANILDIVKKYNLLDDEVLKRTPKSEIMEDFQEDMKLDVVSADVMDPRIGRPMEATIAFKLSFDHRDPETARKVTNELVSLYLNENLKSRTEKTATTSQFLKSEANSLHEKILSLEQDLSNFKQENEGALPELYQYNLNVIERTDAELRDTGSRISELAKRRLELEANLSQLSPYAPTALPTGEVVLGEQDRLRVLESELRRKQSLYNDNHPDVQRLKREVDTLRDTHGDSSDNEEKRRLQVEIDKLQELEQKYQPDSPQLLQQKRLVANLTADANSRSLPDTLARADNPAYVLLQTQIQSIDSESTVLKQRLSELRVKISRFEDYLSRAPEVEKRYQELTRDLLTNTAKYQEITAKQMQAELAKNLETERKGERFTMIEPPIRPDEPVSPNRLAIILVGCLLAVLIGIGSIAIVEAMDESIRGDRDLTNILGVQPLATIPLFTSDSRKRKRPNTKLLLIVGIPIVIVTLLVLIHFSYKPVDVLWFVAMRKLGLS